MIPTQKTSQSSMPNPSSLSVNLESCVICQENYPSQETTAAENGKQCITEAAIIRKDCVSKRLQQIGNVNFKFSSFYAHGNLSSP